MPIAHLQSQAKMEAIQVVVMAWGATMSNSWEIYMDV
jgi:hypothetical protein